MIQQGQVFKLKTKGPVARRRWNSGQRVRSSCRARWLWSVTEAHTTARAGPAPAGLHVGGRVRWPAARQRPLRSEQVAEEGHPHVGLGKAVRRWVEPGHLQPAPQRVPPPSRQLGTAAVLLADPMHPNTCGMTPLPRTADQRQQPRMGSRPATKPATAGADYHATRPARHLPRRSRQTPGHAWPPLGHPHQEAPPTPSRAHHPVGGRLVLGHAGTADTTLRLR
jgi:hypothetical protein